MFRKRLAAPAPGDCGIATARWRIPRIKFRRHEPEHRRRQCDLQRSSATINKQDASAFSDLRRRKPHLAKNASGHGRDGAKPRLASCRNRGRKDDDGSDNEQCVAWKIVERNAEREQHQRQLAVSSCRVRCMSEEQRTENRERMTTTHIQERMEFDKTCALSFYPASSVLVIGAGYDPSPSPACSPSPSSRRWPHPWCSCRLADAGARVVKVERPEVALPATTIM